MNPGLLREPLQLEREGNTRNEIGEKVDAWAAVGAPFRGWQRKPKALQDEVNSDQNQERQRSSYRVRSRPFLTLYQDGDRLVELPKRGVPGGTWEITGWSPVEGTSGEYVDVAIERKS